MKELFYFLVILSSLFTNCNSTSIMQKHYIPENFVGHVTIEFNVEGALSAKDQNGNLEYHIGPEGQFQVSDDLPLSFVNNTTVQFFRKQGDQLSRVYMMRDVDDPNVIAIRGPYPVNNTIHYFVDKRKNLDQYKNPAISEQGREN